MLALAACNTENGAPAPENADTTAGNTDTPAGTVYAAQLGPLNQTAVGTETSGEVRLTVVGDSLTIHVAVQNSPPGISHWQHFHGFADNREATCPTATADANNDGIVDLIETEPVAGTTMVPFNANPVALAIPEESYPTAAADGSYQYDTTVSLSALQAAVGAQALDLANRVVFIHGVPATKTLPETVASLGPIPAQTTIPIACGNLEVVPQ